MIENKTNLKNYYQLLMQLKKYRNTLTITNSNRKVQSSNRNQNKVVEQDLQTISNNSVGINTAIQEGFQGVENRNIKNGNIDTNANK